MSQRILPWIYCLDEIRCYFFSISYQSFHCFVLMDPSLRSRERDKSSISGGFLNISIFHIYSQPVIFFKNLNGEVKRIVRKYPYPWHLGSAINILLCLLYYLSPIYPFHYPFINPNYIFMHFKGSFRHLLLSTSTCILFAFIFLS